MKEPEYQDIGFTHWECCKENIVMAHAELEPVTRIHAILDPCTAIKIGLFFQHKLKLSSTKGNILCCIAEHVFISDEIPAYSFCQLKELMETAQQKFKDKLYARSNEEEIPVTVHCIINDVDVEQVMQQLK